MVATLVALLAYIPYIRDVIRGKTKPHAFSWLVWGVMSMVAFFAQYSDGGGAGTWAVAFSSLADFCIFLLALWKGQKNLAPLDWFCLAAAFVILGLWTFNEDPLIAVGLISAVYIVGFIPTVRKSLTKPQQETATTYFFVALKYIFIITALENYTLVTVMYPAVVGAMNVFFVFLVLSLRQQMGYRLRHRTLKTRKSRA